MASSCLGYFLVIVASCFAKPFCDNLATISRQKTPPIYEKFDPSGLRPEPHPGTRQRCRPGGPKIRPRPPFFPVPRGRSLVEHSGFPADRQAVGSGVYSVAWRQNLPECPAWRHVVFQWDTHARPLAGFLQAYGRSAGILCPASAGGRLCRTVLPGGVLWGRRPNAEQAWRVHEN
jgi:hypothetical protein